MRNSPIAVLLLSLLASGCGTITHGRYQSIPLSTNPEGAAVSLRCGNSPVITAVTPATISVPRRARPCEVRLSKEGYGERVIALERRVSKRFWMNLLWMPALGAAGYAGGETDCAGFLCTTRQEDALGFFILGILPGGIGMAVDGITGAMYQRSPAAIAETLPAK